MRRCVIVGQNMPDKCSDRLISLHDETIICEPLPSAALALRERYCGNSRVEIIEAACDSFASDNVQFSIYNWNGLSSSLGTISEEAKEVFSQYDLSCTETIKIKTVNLCESLIDRKWDVINTLMIDAQGMDLTILGTMASYIQKGIEVIQCEADGLGFKCYNGLPSNSEEDFIRFMANYPQYVLAKVPNRIPKHPDLQWTLLQ